jgi:cytochrome c oxidase subunit 4
MAASQEAPHHHVNYYGIFGLLVILTILTVGAAFLPAVANGSEGVKVLVALTIASIKAAFVALFFMHLKFEGKMIYVIVGVPLALTVILVCALIPDIVVPALNHWNLGAPTVHAAH